MLRRNQFQFVSVVSCVWLKRAWFWFYCTLPSDNCRHWWDPPMSPHLQAEQLSQSFLRGEMFWSHKKIKIKIKIYSLHTWEAKIQFCLHRFANLRQLFWEWLFLGSRTLPWPVMLVSIASQCSFTDFHHVCAVPYEVGAATAQPLHLLW